MHKNISSVFIYLLFLIKYYIRNEIIKNTNSDNQKIAKYQI